MYPDIFPSSLWIRPKEYLDQVLVLYVLLWVMANYTYPKDVVLMQNGAPATPQR